MPPVPWGCPEGTKQGGGGMSIPVNPQSGGYQSQTGRKDGWGWGDISAIQAVSRVSVCLSVHRVCELRQYQGVGRGMVWAGWQHFCCTGCRCFVRKQKKKKIKK